jgi:2-dehydro-3-deoxygluconokinase
VDPANENRREDPGHDEPPDVVTLGECLVALVATSLGPMAEATSFERHVAGAEANVAVGLARLGHHPVFIGRVGADGFGTAIRRRLRGEGVRTDFLRVDASAPTGVLVRERRILGPAEVTYYRAGSAGARLEPGDVDAAADLIRSARWLHLTGITPALSASASSAVDRAADLAHESGLIITLDLNLRRKLWSEAKAASILSKLAARADIVLGSADEAALVTGSDPSTDPGGLAAALIALGPSMVVIKLGSDGALGLARGDEPVHIPGLATTVIDTIGAGDGFAAGFIASRLEGADLRRALEVGNACGAAATSVVGDLAGLPDRAELDRLLAATRGDDAIR